MLQELRGKIEVLEKKYEELQAKYQAKPETLADPEPIAVTAHPAEGLGTILPPALPLQAGNSGYVVDDAVQIYRNAKILYQTGKFAEAILAFTDFLDKFPDHPMAGAAQYHVASAYFHQKAYPFALREYEKVLLAYDRSSHLPDALKDLVQLETQLGKTDAAAKHRQMLTSLFPQSPAAGVIINTPMNAPVSPPVNTPPLNNHAPESAPGTTPGTPIDEPPPATAPLNPGATSAAPSRTQS